MNLLEITNLNKTYPAFRLTDVSFSVPAGCVTGFIGRTGAGKTTTLKSILGSVHPDSGRILFQGTDVRKNEQFFKENIGVVFGEIDFYLKKKLEDITDVTRRFYSSWNQEKYRYYCNLFALEESKKVEQLSSGMRTKYLIALSLSHNAKLLIMDEPTSGLDPVSRDELTELFRAIVKSGERSILFSTHITSDLEKCADRIVFIKDGQIVQSDTLDSFLNTNRDRGSSLEDIIISLERRPLGESAIL